MAITNLVVVYKYVCLLFWQTTQHELLIKDMYISCQESCQSSHGSGGIVWAFRVKLKLNNFIGQ